MDSPSSTPVQTGVAETIVVRRFALPGATDEYDALIDLRARVLRVGRPRETAIYPGDDLPTTIHLGAFQSGLLVGVTTLLEKEDGTLRLRGMAVIPDLQNQGVGAKIVQMAQVIARERNIDLTCSARATAVGFYERLGWVVESDVYDVLDVGPHYTMRWAVCQ